MAIGRTRPVNETDRKVNVSVRPPDFYQVELDCGGVMSIFAYDTTERESEDTTFINLRTFQDGS